LTSTNLRRPSSPTAKLDTELSLAFVANKKRQSGSQSRRAPSNGFGVLSLLTMGLYPPDPAPSVAMRSDSVIVPFAART
jgi:hypothetical protein